MTYRTTKQGNKDGVERKCKKLKITPQIPRILRMDKLNKVKIDSRFRAGWPFTGRGISGD